MATIYEVANNAGLSRTTVSRYINSTGYVSQEAKDKIEKAIKELNYRPNKIAQSLSTRTTGNIAVVISDISNPIAADYTKGIEAAAYDHNYNILLCNTGFDLKKEISCVNILMQKQIDGIIIAPCGKGREHLEEVVKRKIPLVFVTRKILGIEADYVRFANEEGSFKIVEHLIKLGHKRIGIICRDIDIVNITGRLKGYMLAHENYNLPVEKELIISGKAVESFGYDAMSQFVKMQDPPTAIYTAVNLFAAGSIRYCNENDLKIPEEISLASFESFGELDAIIRPKLTSNVMPAFQLGYTAMDMLIKRISNIGNISNREVSLSGEILIRESTMALGDNMK